MSVEYSVATRCSSLGGVAFVRGQCSYASGYHGRALVGGKGSGPSYPEQDAPVNHDGRGDCLALGRYEGIVATFRLRKSGCRTSHARNRSDH